MIRLAITVIATIWLAFSPLSVAAAQSGQLGYTLGSGDRVSVTVFGHADLSGEFVVEGSGTIALPLAGDIPVGGLTLRQAETAVEDALKPDYLVNPRVNMQVLNYRPFYILGEVKSPGSYPYVNGMTVVEAVALAGGFTYRADKDDITIMRAGSGSGKEQRANDNTPVLPGDKIHVPERFF